MRVATSTQAAAAQRRARPELQALRELAELIAASARNPNQRDRMVRAARVPLAASGVAALRAVQRYGPLSVTDLARRLGLDQSTTSRQVRPLEAQGLVDRTGDPEDRRASRIGLSLAGRRLLERVDDVLLNDFDAALAGWSDDDRDHLGRLLDRLRRDLLLVRTDDSGWSLPFR